MPKRSLRPRGTASDDGRRGSGARYGMGTAAGLSFFRMIAEHGSDVASVHSRDGRFVFVAPTVERLFGWKERDLLGESLVDLAHFEEQLPLRLALQVESGTEKAAYRIRCADGQERWVETVVQCGPSPDLVVCMTRDVTEHKKNAIALEQGLFKVIEHAPVAMLVIQVGRIRFANAAALERLGADDPDVVVGRALRTFVHPEDAASEEAEVYRVENEGRALGTHDLRLMATDGTVVDGEAYALSVAREGKSAALVVFRPRPKLDPEALVADRLRAVGHVTAGVAHELTDPLSLLSAALDVIEKTDGDAARRGDRAAALSQARAAVDRSLATLRSLRTFACGDADQRVLVDVREPIQSALTVATGQLPPTTSLVPAFGEEAPVVLADPARIAQAVLNLVTNAIHAASERPDGQVVVAARRDGRLVVIEVSDNGRGMSALARERAFEPFFTTKASLGLGLSVARSIVESLGGELLIEASPSEGTTFRIVLTAAEAPVRSGRPNRRTSRNMKRVTRISLVLIVDDDPTLGTALARALRGDYEVTVESTAIAALDRIRAGEKFDAIVCDVLMPGMTGLDLHRELAAIAPDLAARVLFATGGRVAPALRAALDALPNGHLDKPFSVDALRAKLQDLSAR